MRKSLLPLLFIACLATACMSPEQKLVGRWKGKVELGGSLKSTQMGAMAGGFANMIQPQLELRPDKTFTLSMSVAPIDGAWKLEGNQLTLKPQKVMGMTTDEVKNQAQQQLSKSQDKMPFPFPMGNMANGLPMVNEMKATVNEKEDEITLDPGSGTFLAGFGKMTFTKT